jgi:hypothetical protein
MSLRALLSIVLTVDWIIWFKVLLLIGTVMHLTLQGEVCDGVDICDGDYIDLLCESDEGLLPFSTIEQAFESFYPHECPPNTTKRTRKDANRQFRRHEILKVRVSSIQCTLYIQHFKRALYTIFSICSIHYELL